MGRVSETRAKRDKLQTRIAQLLRERDALDRQLAKEQGWAPCDDCFDGYCTMNCSGTPLFIKCGPFP